jgi:hypothetical protein
MDLNGRRWSQDGELQWVVEMLVIGEDASVVEVSSRTICLRHHSKISNTRKTSNRSFFAVSNCSHFEIRVDDLLDDKTSEATTPLKHHL